MNKEKMLRGLVENLRTYEPENLRNIARDKSARELAIAHSTFVSHAERTCEQYCIVLLLHAAPLQHLNYFNFMAMLRFCKAIRPPAGFAVGRRGSLTQQTHSEAVRHGSGQRDGRILDEVTCVSWVHGNETMEAEFSLGELFEGVVHRVHIFLEMKQGQCICPLRNESSGCNSVYSVEWSIKMQRCMA
jgi:hypothetical protein